MTKNLECLQTSEPFVLHLVQGSPLPFLITTGSLNDGISLSSFVLLQGGIAAQYLSTQTAVDIPPDVVLQLQELNILDAGQAYMPETLFGNAAWTDWKSLSILAVGGFLVGFGARYAGSCTSGHTISGLSNLQLPSLIAVIGFFIGGIIMNHYLICFIL